MTKTKHVTSDDLVDDIIRCGMDVAKAKQIKTINQLREELMAQKYKTADIDVALGVWGARIRKVMT